MKSSASAPGLRRVGRNASSARVQIETLRLDFQSSDVLVGHDVGT